MPSVSIVTCTYNRAHLIGETIRSVLEQSFRDFEYIIVDDGSDDNTETVIKEFNDQRIQYFRRPHTGKLSELRNFSHSKCIGEFIAYIDSDDLWKPTKLERQIALLRENPKAGFSFTDIEIFSTAGVLKKNIYNKTGTYVGNLFRQMLGNELVICHTTLVIRKSSLEAIGPSDESFRSGDHDFVFRLSHDFDAAIIYEPLVRVRKHDQNSTSGLPYVLEGFAEHHWTLKKLLDQQLITPGDHKRAYQKTSYAFGRHAAEFRDYDSALHYFKESIRGRPLHIKTLLKIAQTLSKKVLGH